MTTMTTWGAYAKLEALAAAAERYSIPGRTEIRGHVESLLGRSDLSKDVLAELLAEWRGELGAFRPKTAAWLDEEIDRLLDYLALDEVILTGAELLDHLIDGSGHADLDEHVADAASNYHLVSLS